VKKKSLQKKEVVFQRTQHLYKRAMLSCGGEGGALFGWQEKRAGKRKKRDRHRSYRKGSARSIGGFLNRKILGAGKQLSEPGRPAKKGDGFIGIELRTEYKGNESN